MPFELSAWTLAGVTAPVYDLSVGVKVTWPVAGLIVKVPISVIPSAA